MLALTNTTDSLQLSQNTGVGVSGFKLSVHYVDYDQATGAVVGTGRQNTSITTNPQTVLAAPAASVTRVVEHLEWRANTSAVVGHAYLQYNANGTLFELAKMTANADNFITYQANTGFKYNYKTRFSLYQALRRDTIIRDAASPFWQALFYPVSLEAGINYNYKARIIHQQSAATVGANFGGITIPLGSAAHQSLGIDVVTNSATAAALSEGFTSGAGGIIGQTTGAAANALGLYTGEITGDAAFPGEFVFRATVEAASAGFMTVRAGSWLHVWEADK